MDTWICRYCNKELALKNKFTKSGHLSKCQKWKEFRNSIKKEDLQRMYLTEKKSVAEIGEILGFKTDSYMAIGRLFDKFEIPRRTIKEATNLPGRKLRSAKTSLKRYGVSHNFCREHPSRIKWQLEMLENEGITNVFQRNEVIKKITNTFEEKYGIKRTGNHFTHREFFKGRAVSNLQKNIYTFIKDIVGETYLEEILKRDEKRYYAYDIFIPKLNLIVEVYGDYWHCNPIKYKPADIVCWGNWKITAEECWKKDFEKIDFAYKKGYNVLLIWENDWNNTANFKEEVSEYFKNQVY